MYSLALGTVACYCLNRGRSVLDSPTTNPPAPPYRDPATGWVGGCDRIKLKWEHD